MELPKGNRRRKHGRTRNEGSRRRKRKKKRTKEAKKNTAEDGRDGIIGKRKRKKEEIRGGMMCNSI